jgi:hypothetical protein
MRVRRSLLVLLLVVLISSAKSSAYFAATPDRSAHMGHAMHAAPYAQDAFGQKSPFGNPRDAASRTTVIDGSKTPELIPDELAYRHFIRATASSASAKDVERREVFLTQAGFSASDREAYRVAVGNVAEELKSVEQQRKTAGPSQSASSLAGFKRTEDQAIAAAQNRIQGALSADGRAKLTNHIRQRVKRQIRMFSSPMTK